MIVPPEVLTMAFGSVGGFVMRHIAEKRNHEHLQHMAAVNALEAEDESKDKAAERAGLWVRRFLVLSVSFGAIFAPFLLSTCSDTPTVVQYTEKARGLLGWIFGGEGKQVMRFKEITGYLLSEEVLHAFFAIIGFYFGQSVRK